MEEVKAAAEQTGAADTTVATKNKSEDYFADFDFAGLSVDMRLMLKNGVHFGHQKSRKNPKMSEYIFGTKNGINIIDLEKTVKSLEEANLFIEKIVSEGQEILFVGTKKQAKNIVESAAKACGMPYVVERWLGGTFTNFKNISGRTKYLRDGQEKMVKGEYAKYTKFEQMKFAEELERMESRMGGIKHMLKYPGAIFVTGVLEDSLAIAEARKKNIPIIALADTNVDPTIIDYPIPANEDAVSSLRLMVAYVTKAVIDGKEKAGAIRKAAAENQVVLEKK
ncbi:MAG: 30S ribosomal protein S2 [Parcubacteria group bacterium]|jgi:small subunit ribosomal protein S2